MKDLYRVCLTSKISQEKIYSEGNLRISVLTPSLLRIEWSEKNKFVDKPSQKVWCRNFSDAEYSVKKEKYETLLETSELKVGIKCGKSLSDSIRIVLKHPNNVINNSWCYGENFRTLGGTARTLDCAKGEIPLENGIVSREGFSVLEDSTSYLIEEDGTLSCREDSDSIDLYFFGYGHKYKEAVKDFLKLTGGTPLLPRFVFGNWWSRYYRYTQEEYLELMERFKKEGIPLSVAMIDMDWHLTKIPSDIGTGWTGYTWNEELFPDHKKFLKELHEKKLHVSLNVHPAEGIGRHEKAYGEMKKALGQEEDGKTISFDIASPEFTEAYFEKLHHPLEEEGVDFWWVDWQQGNSSSRKNLDPLWLLNHYHYLDKARNKKRPLILSRYAGEGSQRYPIGFSGDTVISWESLDFQPYFTITASNIGFGWWSHDIGGHMLGTYDEELQVRWVQWGSFSPIMRLHSSASPFNHKEPWHYGKEAELAVKDFLLLRHRMIPYLYTMNKIFYDQGRPLLVPLYWEHPEKGEAYDFKNEYYFGTELLCAPVTKKIIREVNRAETKVWLPEGSFTDVFSGMNYKGNRTLSMYRNLDTFPLLLKNGGILPLMKKEEAICEGSAEKNPDAFDLYVSCGDDGEFLLYEDEGDGFSFKNGKSVTTKFSYSEKEKTFVIHKAEGDLSLVPSKREYAVHFLNCDFTEADLKGKIISYDFMKRELVTKLSVSTNEEAKINLKKEMPQEEKIKLKRERELKRVFALLDKMNIEFLLKEKIYSAVEKSIGENTLCTELLSLTENTEIIKAVMEQLENN